jgi:hypothetical protein
VDPDPSSRPGDAATIEPEPTAEPGPRSRLLLATAAVSAVEALAVATYAVTIAVSAARSGSVVAAAPIEVAVYLLFAAGIALATKGVLSRRRIARAPYVLTQLFGVISGWTLVSGDGTDVHVYGWLVLLVSLTGLALAMNRQVGEALTR